MSIREEIVNEINELYKLSRQADSYEQYLEITQLISQKESQLTHLLRAQLDSNDEGYQKALDAAKKATKVAKEAIEDTKKTVKYFEKGEKAFKLLALLLRFH